MWTDITRAQHARSELALPTDLTNAEWRVLEPFFPPPSLVGRPRKWPMRRIVEAILYLLRGGPPWQDAAALLPAGVDRSALVLSVARQRAVADVADDRARDAGSRRLAERRRDR